MPPELRAVGDTVSFDLLAKGLHLLQEGQLENALLVAEQLSELGWEKLHHGNWKDVPPVWRRLYGWAALVKSSCHCLQGDPLSAVKAIDLALMMGGPAVDCKDQFNALLDWAQNKLREESSSFSSTTSSTSCLY